MQQDVLPDPPADSELARWIEEGTRIGSSRSNILSVDAPDKRYNLHIEVDGPISGFLIDLYHEDTRLARTVVEGQDTAITVATELVAAAAELRDLDQQPQLRPERDSEVEEDANHGSPRVPNEWDEAEDEWEEALQDAFDDAEIPRSKGSLVTKTIDGRDYYYLQWREGDTVTSQYVAPASPS